MQDGPIDATLNRLAPISNSIEIGGEYAEQAFEDSDMNIPPIIAARLEEYRRSRGIVYKAPVLTTSVLDLMAIPFALWFRREFLDHALPRRYILPGFTSREFA